MDEKVYIAMYYNDNFGCLIRKIHNQHCLSLLPSNIESGKSDNKNQKLKVGMYISFCDASMSSLTTINIWQKSCNEALVRSNGKETIHCKVNPSISQNR